MWNNENFEIKDLISFKNVNHMELTEILQKLLDKINKQPEEYSIFQHLIWPRYDTIEKIKLNTMKNGLDVNSIGLASTTHITGNTRLITPQQIMDYHYDSSLNAVRNNMAFVIPLTITDEFGRKIDYCLDKHHYIIPWREGKMCTILDYIAYEKMGISNTYSIFNLKLDVLNDNYSCQINTKAFPFLSREEKQKHYHEVSKIIKKILVNQYKVLTEDEYKNVNDLNPYIEKLIMSEYEKVKNEVYANPECWLEP